MNVVQPPGGRAAAHPVGHDALPRPGDRRRPRRRDRHAALRPSDAGAQDRCVPTTDLTFDTAAWPLLTFGPQDQVFGLVPGVQVPLEQLSLALTVDPTGDRLTQGTLRAQIDTAPLGEVLELGTAPDGVCALLATLGTSCVPCASSGSPYCAPYEATGLRAAFSAGLTVPERTVADIDADPACQ
ncbi:MAG: hypothetical protein R3F59_31590 [Myxococcota bacterium]